MKKLIGVLFLCVALSVAGTAAGAIDAENLLRKLASCERLEADEVANLARGIKESPEILDLVFNGMPVFLAILDNEYTAPQIIRACVEAGADRKSMDKYGYNAFEYCMTSSKSAERMIRALIDAGATVESSLLFSAVQINPSIDIFKLLLKAGANINIRDAERRSVLIYALDQGQGENLASYLINSGAQPDDIDLMGRTPLMYAVAYGYSTEIIQLLIDAGADVNAVDFEGNSVLMYALRYHPDSLGLISTLLSLGADANLGSAGCPERPAKFPLGEALKYTSTSEIVRCLINAGANPSRWSPDTRIRILQEAVRQNPFVEVISQLMETCKASGIDTAREASYALGEAIYNPNPDMIRYLISKGADINTQDPDGRTALINAVIYMDDSPLAEDLRQQAMEENELQYSDVKPILDYFMSHTVHPAYISLLLELGADPAIQDKSGHTALDYVRLCSPESYDIFRKLKDDKRRDPRPAKGQ